MRQCNNICEREGGRKKESRKSWIIKKNLTFKIEISYKQVSS